MKTKWEKEMRVLIGPCKKKESFQFAIDQLRNKPYRVEKDKKGRFKLLTHFPVMEDPKEIHKSWRV